MISGILEIVGNGAAFVRQQEASYLASKNDIFVGSKLIQRYGLRTGDEIIGEAGDSPGRGKSAPLVSISSVKKPTRSRSSSSWARSWPWSGCIEARWSGYSATRPGTPSPAKCW